MKDQQDSSPQDSGSGQNQNGPGNSCTQPQSDKDRNNQQPTSSISAEDVQQLLNSLSKGMGNLGSNPAPQNHHSSDIAITRRANERNGKVPEKNQAVAKAATDAMSRQGKEAIYQVLNSISTEIAQNQAEDEKGYGQPLLREEERGLHPRGKTAPANCHQHTDRRPARDP